MLVKLDRNLSIPSVMLDKQEKLLGNLQCVEYTRNNDSFNLDVRYHMEIQQKKLVLHWWISTWYWMHLFKTSIDA